MTALKTAILTLFVAAMLLGASTATADHTRVPYYGSHPHHSYTGGFCYGSGVHYHAYAPDQAQLYRWHNNVYYYVGDPSPYGYAYQTYVYQGVHPLHLGLGWCFIQGRHQHYFAPTHHHAYRHHHGVYWYVGAYDQHYYNHRHHYDHHGYRHDHHGYTEYRNRSGRSYRDSYQRRDSQRDHYRERQHDERGQSRYRYDNHRDDHRRDDHYDRYRRSDSHGGHDRQRTEHHDRDERRGDGNREHSNRSEHRRSRRR